MAFFGCCSVQEPSRTTVEKQGRRGTITSAVIDGQQRRSAQFSRQHKDPQLSGIGIIFHGDKMTRQFKVAAILPGPAKSSGQIRIGDELKTVNGQQVDPDDTAALAQLIIGPNGSPVNLTFRRGCEMFTVCLLRGNVGGASEADAASVHMSPVRDRQSYTASSYRSSPLGERDTSASSFTPWSPRYSDTNSHLEVPSSPTVASSFRPDYSPPTSSRWSPSSNSLLPSSSASLELPGNGYREMGRTVSRATS